MKYQKRSGDDCTTVMVVVGVFLVTLSSGDQTNENLIPKFRSNVTPSMSVDMVFDNRNWNASQAIDGNADGDPNTCNCCSSTKTTGQTPWWQLDLGDTYLVGEVVVYGRNDDTYFGQFGGFLASISNSSMVGRSGDRVIYTEPNNAPSQHVFNIRISPPDLLKYIMISRPRETILTICEVEVHEGDCLIGKYGDKCAIQCHCFNNAVCDKISGTCPSGGCQPGWIGAACNTVSAGTSAAVDTTGCYITSRTYNGTASTTNNGRTCQAWTSHSQDDFPMDDSIEAASNYCRDPDLTGFPWCYTTDPDHRWESCGIPLCADCSIGTYGYKCATQCHCFNNAVCDQISGTCPPGGCQPGWIGAACNTDCSIGTYGDKCVTQCYCFNNAVCDKISGTCPPGGCQHGWMGAACDTVCPVGTFGANCSQKCHCSADSPCNQVDGRCPTGCKFGWAGETCSIDQNFIPKMRSTVRTSMSADLVYGNTNWNSSLAIDGKAEYNPDSCDCCSSTERLDGGIPWWQLDLGAVYLLSDFVVYGREDHQEQFRRFTVKVSNSTMTDQGGNLVYTDDGTNTSIYYFHIQLPSPSLLQYVMISLNVAGKNVLTICEVKVYEGDCPVGTYGDRCGRRCHCFNHPACNNVSGKCPPGGCEPGWKGAACDTECGTGKFSLGCNRTCHCDPTGDTCNKRSGICPGRCDVGYIGETCEKECDDGTFGRGCNRTCHCSHLGKTCNKQSGKCPGHCETGYHGDTCESECDDWKFGIDCNKTCHCSRAGGMCNKSSGICPGDCEAGYQGNTCENECGDGTFGLGCNRTCHCSQFGNTCNKSSGICPGVCEAGYDGDTCENECGDGTFGLGCNRTCHCSSFGNTCNKSSGICPCDCEAGYHGDTCENECGDGTFGVDCNMTCHCSPFGNTCNKSSGICPGVCEAGYHGDTCENECGDGTFGVDCNRICHCSPFGNTCNKSSGICPGVCEAGYHGDTCENECDDGIFGVGCNRTCHCSSFGKTCNKSSGICPGVCEAGYHGGTCENECDDGTFGIGCNMTCYCSRIGGTCNKGSGICPGYCEAGYHGTTCGNVCTNRTYGVNCNETCGHCMNQEPCHIRTGNCSRGCESLYSGTVCLKYEPLSSDDATPAGAIGGAVGGAIVLLLAVIATIFILKRRRRNAGYKDATASAFDRVVETDVDNTAMAVVHVKKPKLKSEHNRGQVNQAFNVKVETSYYEFAERADDIKLCQLYDYILRDKLNEWELLYGEFKKLKGGLQYGYDISQLENNRGKNRYRDMYAYDDTRVHLEVNEPDETDYINACHIDGYEKVKKFIASQGPTQNMVEDFWSMVLQQKAEIIVMLTNVIELGQQKCIQYWPDEDETQYGRMTIKLIKCVAYPDYVIRTLEVKRKQAQGRRVTQFHFKAWPDKDVPDDAWSLVNFWRVVTKAGVTTSAPVIVHCSAGVGRTGTYIALDKLYRQAKAEGVVRPLSIVEGLRRQRVNMVQTKEQYVYLHEAVAEALCVGTDPVPVSQFEGTYRFMSEELDGDTQRPMLALQYDLLLESLVESRMVEADNEPEYSNVASEIDAYRPKVLAGQATNGRDIGEFYLPNHKGNSTFIAAQSPSKATLEEFWSLIAQNNIKTVIMLTAQSDEHYSLSSQLGVKDTSDVGPYVVNFLNERRFSHFNEVCLTFRKQEAEEDDLTTVKQFQFRGWRDRDVVPGDPQAVLDMMEAVERWQPHVSENQPVLVHCRSGTERTGLWCVLMRELQRLKVAGGVNILETVKSLKMRNSQLIPNYEQYKFCHDVILAKVADTDVYQNV